MRRFVIAAAFLLAACSTSRDRVQIQPPDIQLRQVIGPADQGYPSGPIQVRYEIAIANRSSEPLTLTRIEVESVGTGAYQLIRDALRFNQTVAPLSTERMQFWVRAFARPQSRAGVGEPVTFRGIFYFDTPVGQVHRVLMTNLPQGQRNRD